MVKLFIISQLTTRFRFYHSLYREFIQTFSNILRRNVCKAYDFFFRADMRPTEMIFRGNASAKNSSRRFESSIHHRLAK